MREVERLTIAGTMAGQIQTSERGMEIEKRYGVALESTDSVYKLCVTDICNLLGIA